MKHLAIYLLFILSFTGHAQAQSLREQFAAATVPQINELGLWDKWICRDETAKKYAYFIFRPSPQGAIDATQSFTAEFKPTPELARDLYGDSAKIEFIRKTVDGHLLVELTEPKTARLDAIADPTRSVVDYFHCHKGLRYPLSTFARTTLDKAGLPFATLNISNIEIAWQETKKDEPVYFDEGFPKALENLLTANTANSALEAVHQKFNLHDAIHAQSILKILLNHPTTRFAITRFNERAPDGEMTTFNWIIKVTIPNLSKQTFWIIVHRMGNRPTYHYGTESSL